MDDTNREAIATSLTAYDVRIFPFLPYLLQDLWELGSNPREITRLFQHSAHLNECTSVLDLGCGKGAVSIALAKQIGCSVVGIDLMELFIEEARRQARVHGVEKLCTFSVADIVNAVTTQRGYDAVVYGAVGDVFPNKQELLSHLKTVVRPDGFILIDDAVVREQNHADCLTQLEWERVINQAGLRIVETIFTSPEEMAISNRSNQQAIEQRAHELTMQHPEKADLFAQYVYDQQKECDDLESWMQGVTWLLQIV